ncbi:23S rRNA pseudouridine(2604) synthase [Lachnospiraceae bacterium]|jgi:23S rRNA pseudouridine2604 synthase|nr:pseudouridine synthase [Lachnospiraceae bacterium]GFH93275.1 23S rRNA pseudouridine(2604) synthase [Lachnospiraceae bacterium]
MEEKKERLNKYLAACGICSRREADRIIEMGKVTVDGEIASMGMQVTGQEEIAVHGKKVFGKNDKVVLAYYKPAGVTCTEKDRHAERKISDELKYPVRLTYAGRLDKDSEGLLIMTNDGDLIEQMMRGANCHEKEYQVRVDKPVSDNFLKGMSEGVYLEDLDITTRKCKVRRTGRYTFSMILTQGVNRQIRRMTESFGYRVRALRRIRVLNITLEGLKPGEYRVLQGEELEKLYRECTGKTMRKIEMCEENA